MTARKITLVLWVVQIEEKAVANLRAGIKHLTWSFEVQLVKEEWIDDKGQVTKRNNGPWLNDALLVLNVGLFCYSNEWGRESVCPARKICEEETERAFARPFILPGKVIRVVWLKSSSLDENIKIETSTTKIIPALNNNLKFFLSATPVFQSLKCTVWRILQDFANFNEWLNSPNAKRDVRFALQLIFSFFCFFVFSVIGNNLILFFFFFLNAV